LAVPKREKRLRAPDPRYVIVENRPDGVPLPYRLNEAGVDVVRSLCAEGVSLATVWTTLGISEATFINMRSIERDPDQIIQAAIDEGRGQFQSWCVDALKVHAIEKSNLTALIFLAKTRGAFVEQAPTLADAKNVTNNTQINITIPPAMTDEQFQQLRQITGPATDITPEAPKPKVLR
jgi:hypothetical protein